MTRLIQLSKRCTTKQAQTLLLRPCNHNCSSAHSYTYSYRWLACAVSIVSAHHSHSRWRGRQQACAESAVISVPLSPAKVEKKLVLESKIWKCLKKLVYLSRDIIRILKRAFYLGLCFAPPIAAAPLLLLGSPDISMRWWEMVRRSIWAAGPCLTKFSQWAATRPDIFPQYLCSHLAQLQSNTQPHAWSSSEKVLSRAFGAQWRELFGQLDTGASVGSGLVAQVYRGTLATPSDGEEVEVAIKVLHPDVKKALEDDLAMMRVMVQWLETVLTWGESGLSLLGLGGSESGADVAPGQTQGGLAAVFSLSESVEEFRELMTEQLNLRREGDALTRFRQNFSGRKWANRVVFPTPIDMSPKVGDDRFYVQKNTGRSDSGYIGEQSTDVLVETFQRGIPVTEVLQRKAAGDDDEREDEREYSWPPLTKQEEKQVAALGMDVVLKMIFEDNFIHGDLHPGNLLLTRRPKDENEVHEQPFQLVLLDTGIYTELGSEDRKNFLSLFKAVIDDNGAGAARMMIEKSREYELPNGQKTRLQPVRQEEFEKKMGALVHKARRRGLRMGGEDGDMGGVSGLLRDVLGLCYEHRVKLDSHFVSVVLGVAIIEGLGRRLDPDIDLLERAAPFIARAAARAVLHPTSSV